MVEDRYRMRSRRSRWKERMNRKEVKSKRREGIGMGVRN